MKRIAGWAHVLLIDGCLLLVSIGIGVTLNGSFVAGPQEQIFTYSEEGGQRQLKALEEIKPTPALPTFPEVKLADLKKMVEKGDTIVLDGRRSQDYEAGHIPGAHSLSVADFETRFFDVSRHLPKEARMVVYCGAGACSLSKQLAAKLRQKGYTRIQIYFAGYNDWFLNGNPIMKGKDEF